MVITLAHAIFGQDVENTFFKSYVDRILFLLAICLIISNWWSVNLRGVSNWPTKLRFHDIELVLGELCESSL
jgi:hypothetical protein